MVGLLALEQQLMIMVCFLKEEVGKNYSSFKS